QPDIVLLGSSVVYRGLDPATIPAHNVYNSGISALRIREAEAFVQQTLHWAGTREIVLGVDYFAFDRRHPHEADFDPALSTLTYLLETAGSAFLSRTAISDAWRLLSHPVV